MEKQANTTSFPFALLLILLFFTATGKAKAGKDKAGAEKKLFVFGDSSSDTGNWKRGTAVSWKPPYGSTFPAKPAGSFSDGRILANFIASYLGISSPVPYEERRWPGATRRLRFGMNFAYGGTGVFNTDVSQPTMTTQIHFFQNLLEAEISYAKPDLESSIALVTLGGNDYANFLKHGSLQDMPGFTRSVVKQLVSNLNRIHSLGVPKVAVAGLAPMGCLPAISFFSSYLNCSDKINGFARFHNRILEQQIGRLNKQSRGVPAFFFLDLYGAFISGLEKPKHPHGKLQYENPLKTMLPRCD